MPAISIRTSAEAYIADNNRGIACKTFVQQILSIAPDLSIGQVIKDSLTEYDAILRIMDNPDVAFRISNSGSVLYMHYGYFNAQGDFIGAGNASAVGFFEKNSYFKAISIGVDGSLMYIMGKSSYISETTCVSYCMFTSTGQLSPIYGVGSVGLGATQYPLVPGVQFGRTTFYTSNPAKDNYEYISFVYESAIGQAVKAGYSHAFLPTAWRGDTTTRGFINVKWGGKYNIYTLYDASGPVKTLPGETVSINGVEMLSPGDVTVIE